MESACLKEIKMEIERRPGVIGAHFADLWAHRGFRAPCRRHIIQVQVELLAVLNPDWAQRGANLQREIRRDHLFNDR